MLELILTAMKEKNYTGYKLANLAGMQHGKVYRIINGKEPIGFKMFEKLISVMGYEMVITLKEKQ